METDNLLGRLPFEWFIEYVLLNTLYSKLIQVKPKKLPSDVHAYLYPHRGTREGVGGEGLIATIPWVFVLLQYFGNILSNIDSLWCALLKIQIYRENEEIANGFCWSCKIWQTKDNCHQGIIRFPRLFGIEFYRSQIFISKVRKQRILKINQSKFHILYAFYTKLSVSYVMRSPWSVDPVIR